MHLHSESNANFSCTLNEQILLQITQLRDVLGEMQRFIQDKHLNCCIFEGLRGGPQVARAIHELSTKRIGALIALEREIGLGGYVSSGTILNAELSTSLLLSLFYPGNPLHDGAVIIRGTSVVAAGCVLPLPADPAHFKLKGRGMRHRAGVGLTQVSDALVFIVSEETGTVSMATAGQMVEINTGSSSEAMTTGSNTIPMGDNVISVH
jgi:DNA integrity scanning protein DisA with diadenylate cyclase activity